MLTSEEIRFLAGALRSVQFFASLSGAQVDAIIAQFTKKTYKRGKTIIRQGDHGKELSVIYTGRVEVFKKKFFGKTPITHLSPGAIIGEMALVCDDVTIASVAALEDTEVFAIARNDFQGVLQLNPGLQKAICAIVDTRLFETHKIEGNC